MESSDAVRLQFEASAAEMDSQQCGDDDPLMERQFEVVPGMINKYGNRVLCLLTSECASYCRFCTRRRLISEAERGPACRSHVDGWADYLRDHPEVREVIFSGGDPFTVSDGFFDYALQSVGNLDQIRVVRIGTRAPVSDPSLVTPAKLDSIEGLSQTVYVGIHFEHPSELTDSTAACIKDLQRHGEILVSQSVFLKGVNDDYQTLYDLFTSLFEVGVRPYYIYRCDPVEGAMHFRADFDKERRIMTQLRSTLSGLACPTYVIDAPHGSGKIPAPLEFWDSDTTAYTDFLGEKHESD
jgi:lysine 2,3-aminomutase